MSGLTREMFETTILSQVFEPRRRLDGSARDEPDQIHHLACHCDTFGDALAHRFVLQGEDGQAFGMSLGTLQDKHLQLALLQGHVECEKRLVFLNKCGATSVDPRQLGSFAHFFLGNGNRGLVGSQIMIPDSFAAAFSERFYSALVFDGLSVGEAALSARRKLAEQEKNALGLLYTHYGPMELQIAAWGADHAARVVSTLAVPSSCDPLGRSPGRIPKMLVFDNLLPSGHRTHQPRPPIHST